LAQRGEAFEGRWGTCPAKIAGRNLQEEGGKKGFFYKEERIKIGGRRERGKGGRLTNPEVRI